MGKSDCRVERTEIRDDRDLFSARICFQHGLHRMGQQTCGTRWSLFNQRHMKTGLSAGLVNTYLTQGYGPKLTRCSRARCLAAAMAVLVCSRAHMVPSTLTTISSRMIALGGAEAYAIAAEGGYRERDKDFWRHAQTRYFANGA